MAMIEVEQQEFEMGELHRVLLIEDDPAIAQAIELALSPAEYVVEHVDNGRLGLERALSGNYDIIVTDINLPELSGFDITRKLREVHPTLPILVLTARQDEIDVVLGLEQGADDYLVKPFRVREFVSRVRALLRRATSAPAPSLKEEGTVVRGILSIDPGSRKVFVEEVETAITKLEFELLWYLVQHEGTAVSREALLSDVWEYEAGEYDVTLTSQISRLRKKLGLAGEYIETVRGYGYRFVHEHA